MNGAAALNRDSQSQRLPDHRCPACGMPAPALLATLPSGRRVLVEACAVCGRQNVAVVGASVTRRPSSTHTCRTAIQGSA